MDGHEETIIGVLMERLSTRARRLEIHHSLNGEWLLVGKRGQRGRKPRGEQPVAAEPVPAVHLVQAGEAFEWIVCLHINMRVIAGL